jgi:hypothetical protein
MWLELALVGLAGYIAGWLGAVCAATLIFVWRVIPASEGPPVLKLAMTTQWIQVSVGVFYVPLVGHELEANRSSDYVTMVLIGLGCIAMFSVGFALGKKFMMRRKAYPPIAPMEMTTLGTLVVVYVIGVVVTGLLQEIAFNYPTYTQALIALSLGRMALIYLMLRRLSRPVLRWELILALLSFEVLIGFTGYFSSFKEPLLLAALALLENFDPKRKSHWAVSVALGGVLIFVCVMWMGVRGQYRQDYDDELYAASRSERLEHMQALVTDWFNSNQSPATDDLDFLVDRAWAIYYPALAVHRVPSVLPFENGALMKAVLVHLTTPRILYPNKPDLPSESELVRKYSGVMVAGAEQNTTIAFGYAAESYVDFGIPFMFLPMLIAGIGIGAAYEWLLRSIAHRDLAVAVVTSTFWINLYMFERSWAKILGLLITMLVYVGLVAWVVDRWLLMRYVAATPGEPEAAEPAYGMDQ